MYNLGGSCGFIVYKGPVWLFHIVKGSFSRIIYYVSYVPEVSSYQIWGINVVQKGDGEQKCPKISRKNRKFWILRQ